ncbi:MAG TPA: mammalian cell entry protein [Janthinobacterium sp.]|nr:mammalian cell entry protein [Janthinobacterium sp.]
MPEKEGDAIPAPIAPSAALPPQPQVEAASRWLPSLVWLIPLLAALIGVGLVARSMFDEGPTVTVSFRSGEGLEPGKTKVKYKDVEIGQVHTIKLAPDLATVLVTIDMRKDAKRFASEGTRFWVVRPRIGASGVSGLGTLLSGAYIGVDAGKSEETKDDFVGLENAPPVSGDQKGRLFKLHGDSLGSIDIGSPVYYRRVEVGQVISFALDKAGDGVDMTVFVNAQYEHFVGKNSRWWHASGIDVRLDSSGFKLNTQSLAAMAIGGLAFEAENGQRPDQEAAPETTFALAADQASAMREPDGAAIPTVFYFDQSLRGLAPGASVDFRGIVLGEVRSVGVEFDPGKKSFRMPVTVDLYPGRLGKRFRESLAGRDHSASDDLLAAMVGRGLRAQLRTGNLLTGQLYIALDFFPKAGPAKLDLTQTPLEVPTVPNSLEELQIQVASIVKKLDQVPYGEIAANLNGTLKTANALFKQLDGQLLPEMKDTLTAAKHTFGSAELVLQKDSPLQSDVRQALQQMTQTLQSLNGLSDYLERHPEALIRGKKGDEK